jgi:hypothetical protein
LLIECPTECTRQTTRHSAYPLFPVVIPVLPFELSFLYCTHKTFKTLATNI